MELLIVVTVLVMLDLAAILWGADSTDEFDSPEWDRRKVWPEYRRPQQ